MHFDFGDSWERTWAPVDELRRELSKMFDGCNVRRNVGSIAFPPVNIWENETAYHLEFEVPGIIPESVELTVDGRTLTLQGKREPTQSAEGARPLHRERVSGPFKRSFELGVDVDPQTVSASSKNGVLTVELPKRHEARKVAITVN